MAKIPQRFMGKEKKLRSFNPKKLRLTIKEEKSLIRRYLLWCYKMTKEELDHIDRKFTQLKVDYEILNTLTQEPLSQKLLREKYFQKIAEFKKYILDKEKTAVSQKYLDHKKKILQPEYQYLKNRLKVIKKTIVRFLDRKELATIEDLYEREMTRRIIEARDHT